MLLRFVKAALSGRKLQHARAGPAENPLVSWYRDHTGRSVHKFYGYLEIYHRHFARYRGRSPVLLEIGVNFGGSLQMWRDYFGPGCRLYGVDIEPGCKAFADEATTILIGDQADRDFLARLRKDLPRPDILIDDGGHRMEQQIATFEELYPHIADDGVYLCEDLHTSNWDRFGGGYRKDGSFVEFSKRLIDQLNAWHWEGEQESAVNEFTRTSHGMHYYLSVLVIEKRRMQPPKQIKAGKPML